MNIVVEHELKKAVVDKFNDAAKVVMGPDKSRAQRVIGRIRRMFGYGGVKDAIKDAMKSGKLSLARGKKMMSMFRKPFLNRLALGGAGAALVAGYLYGKHRAKQKQEAEQGSTYQSYY